MVGKGKVSQSGGSTPPPTSQEQNGENQPFSACFYLFFVFILPLSENTFPPYDAPKPRFPPHKFCRCQNHQSGRAWVWLGKCTHTCHGCCLQLRIKKKKKKRKKDRQTHFRIMLGLFPSQCPHTHTPSLSHTPQTHLFDASTPPPKKGE